MQPEARIGHAIRKALEARGAFVFKVHGSDMMRAGLPDLIVCHNGQFVGLEVKTPTGRVSAVQVRVMQLIRRSGGTAEVVRSVDDALAVLRKMDAQP